MKAIIPTCDRCTLPVPSARQPSSYFSKYCEEKMTQYGPPRVKSKTVLQNKQPPAQTPIQTPVTPSERSAIRVLRRAGAVDRSSARRPDELIGATVTALRALCGKGLADWRSRDGRCFFWLTESGANFESAKEAA